MIGVWRAGRGKERALSAGLTLTLVADAEMSRAAVLQPEHIGTARLALFYLPLWVLVSKLYSGRSVQQELETTSGGGVVTSSSHRA